MGLFEPDRLFSRVCDIDIQADLVDEGIDCVLLDIDNTCRSRATCKVPRDVAVWLGEARDAGISLCFVSNNWHSDVYEFAKEHDIHVVAKAMKPFSHGFRMGMNAVGGKPTSTVCVGDQLFTDVLGAHLAGMRAYLVMPLAESDLRHTLLLRNLERVLIGSREPEAAKAMRAQKAKTVAGMEE